MGLETTRRMGNYRRKFENYENDVKLGEGWETRRRIGNYKDWKLRKGKEIWRRIENQEKNWKL